MRDRGYPIEDFEDRAALRFGRPPDGRRALPPGARRSPWPMAYGDGDTEDLRIAMQDFRALFVELVETEPVDALSPEPAGLP